MPEDLGLVNKLYGTFPMCLLQRQHSIKNPAFRTPRGRSHGRPEREKAVLV
jgi:hypothetical protein